MRKEPSLVARVGKVVPCGDATFGIRSTGPWALVKVKDEKHPWKSIQLWVKNPMAIKDFEEMRITEILAVYVTTRKGNGRYFDNVNADVYAEGTKRRNTGDVLDKMLAKVRT